MRMRIRGPEGASMITLGESDTVGDLLRLIAEKTSLKRFELRHGYPPAPLALDHQDPAKPLAELGIALDGEQLIVSPTAKAEGAGEGSESTSSSAVQPGPAEKASGGRPTPTPKKAAGLRPGSTSAGALPPLSLTRATNQAVESDPPTVPVPDLKATMVLRIMPDDNSCLFRAFGAAVLGGVDGMVELRGMVASAIQKQPETYTAVVLEQSPDDYCRWIQTEDSWGGAIELNILATAFEIEVCSIDVQTLRVDRFNEGQERRCVLVYSGVHYDTIALSLSPPPHTKANLSSELDVRVFDSQKDLILERATTLCRLLQDKHYYTDTANFGVRCNTCGRNFVGEAGATQHARETGHYDFGEAAS
ncbi:MAG: ubiquitin-specific protease otu1 [Lichina confinis]|nr:MAG: ubiquitin-specific protease otu1 [Lichina confinis]